ncbi:MAG: hypothetical protein K6G57_00685 [Lachnospiraceae bacterium]|nr:hypothetical protein [Lachnospiraceae bacterium]
MAKLKVALASLVLGIVLLASGLPDLIPMLKAPIDASVTEPTALRKGDHVMMEVNVCYDYLITETTTTEKNGKVQSTKESSRYYAVPVFAVDDQGAYINHLVVVKAPSKDFAAFDKAIERFDEWWDDETGEVAYPEEILVTVDGVLKNMSDKERGFVKQYFDDPDFESYCPAYVLYPKSKGTLIGLTAVGAAILIFGIAYSVVGIGASKKEKAAKAQRAAQAAATGYYNAPQDATFNNDPNGFR